MNTKQKKIEIEPSTKLNYNRYKLFEFIKNLNLTNNYTFLSEIMPTLHLCNYSTN